MRILEPIRNNPVAALCVVLAGIAGWVASHLSQPESAAVDYLAPAGTLTPAGDKSAAIITDESPATATRPVPVGVLPRLKPGMTRLEIEGLIGPPTANSLHPVVVADGRATYQTAYELAEPDLPPTVRPIPGVRRVLPQPPPATPKPPIVVALEFDASKPGHPLLNVLYPDPLF